MATKLTPLDQNTNVGLFLDESGNLVLIAPDGSTEALSVSSTGEITGINFGSQTFDADVLFDNGTTTSPAIRFSNGSDPDHFGIYLNSGFPLFYTDQGTMTFQADVDGGSNAGYVFKHGSKSIGGGNKILEVFEDGLNSYAELDMQGNNIILDDDGDTYLDLGTDDTINFTVGGSSSRLALSSTLCSINTATIRINGVMGLDASDFIGLSLTDGITAASTQSQGEGLLDTQINIVTTVGTTNDVVTLPAAGNTLYWYGTHVDIYNDGANTLQVFPSSGDDLGAGTDTSTTITAGNSARFLYVSANTWRQVGAP